MQNPPLSFECELGWSCDNCGKSGLIMSAAGVIYCKFCHHSTKDGFEFVDRINKRITNG